MNLPFARARPGTARVRARLVLAGRAWRRTIPTSRSRSSCPSAPAALPTFFAAGRQYLSEALKQPVLIENKPGAGSIIGSDEVAKSAPDGYTLLAMSNTHTTNESLVPNKPFQLMRDFVPVAGMNYSDLLMVIHPSVPAKDLKEFIALAKSKPGSSTTRRPAPARRITWPANCSKR